MPTPIGHSLLGMIIFHGVQPRFRRGWVLVFIFAANFPDLDFLPGLLIGRPNAFHHGPSHSLAAAILVGLVFGLIFRYFQKGNFWYYFLVFSGVGFSHLVLDYFTIDTAPPFGAPILWPISDQYFISPVPVFSDVYRGDTSNTFLSGLLIAHNGWTIVREIVILAPVAALGMLLRKKLEPKFKR
jgi:membrane-bound metal-dependent hydrolase YbcI (DUF457 family)